MDLHTYNQQNGKKYRAKPVIKAQTKHSIKPLLSFEEILAEYDISPKEAADMLEIALDELAEIEFDEEEDKYLLALVLYRRKHDDGVRYTFEEILAEDGLTLEDIDKMLEEEDVEIE